MKTRRMFAAEQFKPYSWELSTRDIASSMGLSQKNIIRMDANTSPYLPAKPLSLLSKKMANFRVNEYPDTSYFDLRRALSKYCGIDVNRFVITNGADEALDIIAKTILDPHDEVVIPIPTYSMFRVVSEIMGSKVKYVPRRKAEDNFLIDVEKVATNVTERTKIIFLCSPNNPTGDSVSKAEIQFLLDKCDSNTTIVVDEAYYEFSGKTFADLTERSDNLVVVRTFSKAFSMAGVRVGYIIGSEKATNELNKVRPPNSLSVISLALAQAAITDLNSMKKNVNAILRERNRCFKAMQAIRELEVFPSEGNFILFRLREGRKNSDMLHRHLMKLGFVLRNFSDSSGAEGCLRMTVNTREVNDSFLHALEYGVRNLFV